MDPRPLPAAPGTDRAASVPAEAVRQGELESVIVDVATRFNRLGPMDRIDEPIGDALRDIATCARLEGIYVILLQPGRAVFSEHYEWHAPGIPSFRDRYQDRPLSAFPWLSGMVIAEKTVVAPTLDALPAEAEAERRYIESDGVKSFVLCPMFNGQQPIGCLGFEQYTSARAWPDETVRLFQVAAASFAALVARHSAEETFLEAERDLGLALAETKTLHDALRLCLKAAIAISGVDSGGAYVVSADGGLELVYHVGLDDGFVRAVERYGPDAPNAIRARAGKPIYASTETCDPTLTEQMRAAGLKSMAAIPVRAGGAVIACLNLASHTRVELPTGMRMALEDVGSRIGAAIARVRAEEAQREREALLRFLSGNLPGMLFQLVRQPDGRRQFTYVSDAVKRLHGCSSEEAMADASRIYDSFVKEDRERILAEGDAAARAFAGFHVEARVQAPSGGVRWSYIAATPRRLPDGSTLWDGMEIDITERRRLEERLRQTEKMEAIGQLAGGIAHDFNNQLAGIMGYAELLARQLDDPQSHRFAEKIISTANRAADLAAQLLAFARKGNTISAPVDLHDLVHEVASILAHSIDRRIRIRQHLDASPSWTTGDPTALQSALLNLGLNARDAMPEGGELVFETSVEDLPRPAAPPDLPPGRYVRLAVTDTGAGIDADAQKHLFEPFYTTKARGKGTGLGLAAVYGVVKNHCGAIVVQSAAGRGATFTLYLPSSDPPAGVQSTDAKPAVGRRAVRILLVDDEAPVRETVSLRLREAGHSVVTAEDGVEAVQRYEAEWRDIDLVILDLVMPRMGGRDAFDAMRRINPGVRAIVISGYSVEGEAQELLEAGVLGFLQKPFQGEALVQLVADMSPAA